MGRFVIVAYRPKPGQERTLDALVAKHLSVLAQEGLVSGRPASVMRAEDGTIVEVFEWASADAIERAHTNAAVGALWGEFAAACDYVPLASLAEAAADVRGVRCGLSRADRHAAFGSGCPGIRSYGCFQPGSDAIRAVQAPIAG